MNPRNTVILVVLVAALLGFIVFVEPLLRPPPSGPVKVLPSLKPGAVTRLQLFIAGQKIVVERTNGGWQVIDPILYPAQSAAIETLVRNAALLMPQTRISAQELQGRTTVNQEFGFDTPQATLIFQQDGTTLTLKLGALTPPGDQIYAQVVGLAEIDIIDADFFRKLIPQQLNDWRDPSFVNLTNLNFDGIISSQHLELRRDRVNDHWRMTKPVQSRADNPKIDALLEALQNLQVARFVTDESNTDLESLGLQPPAQELGFFSGTNRVLSLQFGKSPATDTNLVYARRNNQSTIVLVPREAATAWSAGFQEFRDQHLVRFFDGPPGIIEISGQENVTLQRQSANIWHVTKPFEFPADTSLMRNFLDTLTGLQVVRNNTLVAVDDAVPPNSPDYGLAHPVRRYLLKRAVNRTEGASNDVIAELDFGATTNDNIFVRRGDRPDETSVYAVKLSDFSKLPSAALQFRARNIWNFSENNVTKITIKDHGQTQVWIRKGPNSWYTAQGLMPDELMVEIGAQELGALEAQDWVERGEQNRTRYGLTDQSLQISAEIKSASGTQTYTVQLGGTSPRHLRYGLVHMEDRQDWIFELNATLLDRLTTLFNIHESN